MEEAALQVGQNQNLPAQPRKTERKDTFGKRLERISREFAAAVFWLFVIVKLFVFDIDVFLVSKIAPAHTGLISFKFFFILASATLVLFSFKNKYLWLWTLYISLYPLIFLLWKLPYFLFKKRSWNLAIAVVNSAFSYYKSFKYSFAATSVFLISLLIAFYSSNSVCLWSVIGLLIGLVVITYAQNVVAVFRSSGILRAYIEMVSAIRKHGVSKSFVLEVNLRALSITQLNPEQTAIRAKNLENSVLFNRACLFAAKRLKVYQQSRWDVLSNLLTLILLLAMSILSFWAVNYSLFKIDNDYFAFSSPAPGIFDFLYYSFCNLIPTASQQIAAVKPTSQTVSMLASSCSLVLLVIFVSMLLPFRSERQKEQIDEVIRALQNESQIVENFILEEYKVASMSEALTELEKANTSLAKFIFWLTQAIK